MKFDVVTAAAAVILASTFATSASAQTAPRFQNECKNIRYAEVEGKPTILADCPNSAGEMKKASVVIKGIANNDGYLKHTLGNKESTFIYPSCRGLRIITEENARPGEDAGKSGVALEGQCLKKSLRRWVNTQTSIWDIQNVNGELRYPY